MIGVKLNFIPFYLRLVLRFALWLFMKKENPSKPQSLVLNSGEKSIIT